MSVDYIALAGNILLFLLVFNMSATVDVQYMIEKQWHNQKAILVGLVCQFLILPLLGFITVQIIDLDYPEGIMLLVVTSSPGGSYSNWYVWLLLSVDMFGSNHRLDWRTLLHFEGDENVGNM
jgi:predicted Na+-dependent transporter